MTWRRYTNLLLLLLLGGKIVYDEKFVKYILSYKKVKEWQIMTLDDW